MFILKYINYEKQRSDLLALPHKMSKYKCNKVMTREKCRALWISTEGSKKWLNFENLKFETLIRTQQLHI